jgi:hypothetical protein
MSRIAELVHRGVRVVVGNRPAGATSEIPAEFFVAPEPRSLQRSEISAEVTDFAAVYEEAKVPVPFRGYGVDKMAEILESSRLAALPREVRVAAVMASLEAAGVSLPQVLQDAVLRDRALDDFVAAKEREVEALRARNEARSAALRQEIDAFVRERNAEIDSLKKSTDSGISAFAQLRLRKTSEEERLREVLSYFAADDQNPIPEQR